jgi:SagB-type dehydrogenase family enzyme
MYRTVLLGKKVRRMTERDYHQETDYSRTGMGGGRILGAPRPDVFKDYPGLGRVALPEPDTFPQKTYAEVVLGPEPDVLVALDLMGLSRLLAGSHAVTAVASGGGFYFRSVPSAGALYPAELYLAASGIAGLNDGVYHHHIVRNDLTELRARNFAAHCGSMPPGCEQTPALVFFIAAVFGRSAWKYGKRAYRYCCMDCGHLAEALVLAARAMGCKAIVHALADPGQANRLLHLDGHAEGVICAVEVFAGDGARGQKKPATGAERPVQAAHHLEQPGEIAAAYQASFGPGAVIGEVRIQDQDLGLTVSASQGLPGKAAAETRPFLEAVYARRSKRRYGPGLSKEQTMSMLALLGYPPDSAMRLGVLTGGAAGLADGLYLLDGESRTISLVRQGDARRELAAASLGQRFVAKGSLITFMLTDLATLDMRFGPGGYRRALIDAGRAGHRAYLAATSMGLSACGVGAFFDDEVRNLLGLADTARALYFVVSG